MKKRPESMHMIFQVPRSLHAQFKCWCVLRDRAMREVMIEMMKKVVKGDIDLKLPLKDDSK